MLPPSSVCSLLHGVTTQRILTGKEVVMFRINVFVDKRRRETKMSLVLKSYNFENHVHSKCSGGFDLVCFKLYIGYICHVMSQRFICYRHRNIFRYVALTKSRIKNFRTPHRLSCWWPHVASSHDRHVDTVHDCDS